MTEKNIVPNLEAKASDGNPIFSPRKWLERFKQFTKREHKIDITPLLKGENITDTEWDTDRERNSSPRKLYLGSATGSPLPNNPSRI